MTKCPLCGAAVEISEDPVEGELLECPECGSELEILDLDPIVLGEAPQAEEDWGE
ncbi:MAG: lysine biosynthesis protein LysW [Acidobacteriota bacterium]|nr:lysine biosynthesis protein LysW [Acidobacteriota bacterium]